MISETLEKMTPIPRTPDHPDYGITRVDHRYTHGWWVRLYDGEKYHPRLFSDGRHGGRARAHREANRWRDQTLRELQAAGRLLRPGGRRASLSHPRNRTGVAGVQLEIKQKGTPQQTVVWTAIEIRAGRRRTRSFSACRYGYRGAYLWAVYTRAKMLNEEIDLRRLITPPSSPELQQWLAQHGCLRRRVRYN